MTGSFILNGQNVYSRRGNWGEGNVACVFWVSLPVHVHHNDLLSSFSNAWWEFPLLDWLLATVCFSQSFYSAVLTSPPFGDSSVLQGKRTVLRVVNPAKVLKANLWNAICNNWEKAFWRQFPCQSKMFLLKRKILGGIIGKKKERGEREREGGKEGREEGRKNVPPHADTHPSITQFFQKDDQDEFFLQTPWKVQDYRKSFKHKEQQSVSVLPVVPHPSQASPTEPTEAYLGLLGVSKGKKGGESSMQGNLEKLAWLKQSRNIH